MHTCAIMLAFSVMETPDRPPPACSEALEGHLRPHLFRALCDPTRLAVIGRLALAAQPLTVTEVAGCCDVHLSGVSRHLATLREVGVVVAEKEGREVRYALDCVELGRALRGLADALDECRAACCATQGEEPVPLNQENEQ